MVLAAGNALSASNAGRTLNGKIASDPSIGLTASSAIFAALVGTSLLDIANSAPPMRKADYVILALWLVMIVVFAAVAADIKRAPPVGVAWAAALVVGLATAGAVAATTFGGTRDHDHVLLRLSDPTRSAVARLCEIQVPARGITGTIPTKTLGDEFVIFDFDGKQGGMCKTVDIPRSSVLAFQELH